MFVTRAGSVENDDPLRPLSKDRLLVFAIVVNGRSGFLYGQQPELLRESASIREVESRTDHAVRWQPGDVALPGSLTVTQEDGTPVAGPFRFASCADAPAGARVREAVPTPRAPRPAAPAVPPGFSLPQGALPETDLRLR